MSTKNKDLVIKINEIYHDIEAEKYASRHPEIYNVERKQWESILKKYIFSNRLRRNGITLLDIGSGVGFIADCASESLEERDTFIFSDVSSVMLKSCKDNFVTGAWKKIFLVTNSLKFDLPDNSVDVITVNSVLHHLPDITQFFSECNRVLKSDGYLMIKHEPNIRFGQSFLLRFVYKSLMRMRKRNASVSIPGEQGYNQIQFEVIKRLKMTEEYKNLGISSNDVQSYVDINSPTASGSFDELKGFDPYEMVKIHFSGYSINEINTYGFLGKINDHSNVARSTISGVLKFIYPTRGYFFDLIIQK